MVGATATVTATATTPSPSFRVQPTKYKAGIEDFAVHQLFHMSTGDKSLEEAAEFSPGLCLFCPATSADAQENYHHMYKRHGLFIPDEQHLIVDLETFLEYLHLIIFEYKECLYCHTSRRTIQAVQQHMTGTGHCKFDVADEDSEFRDFYDFDASGDGSGDEEEDADPEQTELQRWGNRNASSTPVQVDDSSIRLPSGRVISNRSTPAPRHPSRKPLQPRTSGPRSHVVSSATPPTDQPTTTPGSSEHDTKPPSPSSSSEPQPTSKALQKQERQRSALAVQLASLRASDQRALAHLSASEQRTVLIQSLRQSASLDRSERRFRGHMDSFGNIKSKERFVNDVPGGKAHKNRFFAR